MRHSLVLRALMALMAMSWLIALVPSPPAVAASCPCNLWGNTVPNVADAGPDSGVKLGVRFSSDVDGYVTGIRFYKAATNTGTHVGQLWARPDAGGSSLLKELTFDNETASGWQTASFASPVKIFANRMYMVSYTAPTGHYSYDVGYFNTPRTNGNLHATASGFTYDTSSGTLPADPSMANYWVDPVFDIAPRGSYLFSSAPATPAVSQSGEDDPYQLGTRFTSDVNTDVIGIRYWHNRFWYRPAVTTLWRNDGTALASAEYGEVNVITGWFEVYFDTPVPITSGTEYVASYLAEPHTNGYTSNYFTSPQTNGYFHTPTNAGVFVTSPTSAFPTTQTPHNYWVEPIFAFKAGVTSSLGVDVDPALTFATGPHVGACNGVSQSGEALSGSSFVSLGRLSASTTAVGAQSLHITTNAASGYTVYAQSSGPLNDGRGHTIADLGGGVSNASPGALASPGTTAFGYTTSDSALSVTGLGADRFTNPSANWAPMTASPGEVSYSATGYVDKTVCIAYAATVAGSTPAGRYATAITYTAVPVF